MYELGASRINGFQTIGEREEGENSLKKQGIQFHQMECREDF